MILTLAFIYTILTAIKFSEPNLWQVIVMAVSFFTTIFVIATTTFFGILTWNARREIARIDQIHARQNEHETSIQLLQQSLDSIVTTTTHIQQQIEKFLTNLNKPIK